MTEYSVCDYSIGELERLLDRFSHQSQGACRAKSHLSYFEEYFRFIDAKTILIETPYTDRDYVEDYAAYYARCFNDYGKRCARLHFFNIKIDQAVLATAISGDEAVAEQLRKAYCGFIVVKPLPSTIIGRTCLATYGDKEAAREFLTCDYKIHLFGIGFLIKSLPFQEQDRDVAACATSALWSAFNATGRLFLHHIPSPAEITKAAAASQRPAYRTLPALNGLNPGQMADAIRSVGLEPVYINVENSVELLLIGANAYLHAGIPCLLLGALVESLPNASSMILGRHAVAVAGHRRPDDQQFFPLDATSGTLFRASTLQRLYAHDDQVGPFSRIIVDRSGFLPLKTSWQGQNKERGNIYFKPEILLIPLYHKIRVPIASVVSTTTAFDQWVELAREANFLSIKTRVVWDVVLTESSSLKSELYKDKTIEQKRKERVILADMPRYIWRVTAISETTKLIELYFDATALLQGDYLVEGIPHSLDFCLRLAAIFKNPAFAEHLRTTDDRGLLDIVLWLDGLSEVPVSTAGAPTQAA